jgi:cell wall-associated NlpC family hydrolase
MADSTPVSISDLQPGDLLFYGPGGSDHVAMYVGGDTMIEAPHTGAVVWLTPLRLGDDFVGAGRP